MKGNNGTGNTEERDTWETNKELWDKLNEQHNFTYDCCASKENTKTPRYSDDLKCAWINELDVCWMNPPFSKAREMFELFFKLVKHGVAIYRCDNMETKIWQEVILKKATWIFIPRGRVNYQSYEFKRPEGVGSRFPSALIGYNVEPPKDLDGFTLNIVKNGESET